MKPEVGEIFYGSKSETIKIRRIDLPFIEYEILQDPTDYYRFGLPFKEYSEFKARFHKKPIFTTRLWKVLNEE